MNGNQIGLLVMAIMFFLLGFVAVPPLKQSINDKSKPLILFCVINMLGMWILAFAAVYRMFTI